jgi:hypothetical protein
MPLARSKHSAEHGLHGGQVGAGLEGGLQGQAEPFEVADVDLAEADAEVPAGIPQGLGCGQRLGAVAGLAHERTADHADRPRVEGALDADQGPRRVGVHLGCTGQRQREEDGRIHGAVPQ